MKFNDNGNVIIKFYDIIPSPVWRTCFTPCMLALFAFSPVWGFVSFLRSFLPFHPEWPRATPRSSAWRWTTTACPRSSSTWTTSLGGWEGFGGWVRTRCLLVLILSVNLEQKRMVLAASGVRDRRQKIERLWFGWLGLMG